MAWEQRRVIYESGLRLHNSAVRMLLSPRVFFKWDCMINTRASMTGKPYSLSIKSQTRGPALATISLLVNCDLGPTIQEVHHSACRTHAVTPKNNLESTPPNKRSTRNCIVVMELTSLKSLPVQLSGW